MKLKIAINICCKLYQHIFIYIYAPLYFYKYKYIFLDENIQEAFEMMLMLFHYTLIL
jgi:hypothetical protein